jgi:hypothetical protein
MVVSRVLAAALANGVVLVDDSGFDRPFSFLLSRQPKDPIGDSRMGFWAGGAYPYSTRARALFVFVFMYLY